jgi:hypothetical protein
LRSALYVYGFLDVLFDSTIETGRKLHADLAAGRIVLGQTDVRRGGEHANYKY